VKKAIMLTLFIFLISIYTIGCSAPENNSKEDGKLQIYTTVYPLEYFTQRMAGELVTIQSIYPPGADEHTFEPSQRDMMNIADADLFFYIGFGLEGFVDKAKSTLKNEGVKFFSIGESVDLEQLEDTLEHASDEESHDSHSDENIHEDHTSEELGHEEETHHDHGDVDPHIWLDPILAKTISLAIKNELVLLLPDEAKQIEENYQTLIEDLDNLHNDFQHTFATAKHQEAIVSHSAYGYWEKRYGLKQLSISGLSSASEPSQKQLEELVKTAKMNNLRYILFEQNVSSKLGEIIQQELKADSLTLHNLATLTESDIQNKEDYFTLMKKNLEALKIALNH
jgi:zinc transport system substrate-binding protein